MIYNVRTIICNIARAIFFIIYANVAKMLY